MRVINLRLFTDRQIIEIYTKPFHIIVSYIQLIKRLELQQFLVLYFLNQVLIKFQNLERLQLGQFDGEFGQFVPRQIHVDNDPLRVDQIDMGDVHLLEGTYFVINVSFGHFGKCHLLWSAELCFDEFHFRLLGSGLAFFLFWRFFFCFLEDDLCVKFEKIFITFGFTYVIVVDSGL